MRGDYVNMRNPFIFGQAVQGRNFANRITEIRELLTDLRERQRVFLISPRRYGKTSLILNVLSRLKREGFYVAYIDLYKAFSLKRFVELYAQAISSAAETKIEKAVRVIRDILPGLRPRIEIGTNGTPAISLDYVAPERDMLRVLDEVYEMPEKLALKRKKRFIIAFDEFQEVRNFNGEIIEKGMRASFQHHSNVSYLFAGSKTHILLNMVMNRSKAFYKMGKIMWLGKMPREEFGKFIMSQFERTGFSIKSKAIDRILDIAEDIPYNAQRLSHEIWSLCLNKRQVGLGDVERALVKILDESQAVFIPIWDRLTLHQRQALHAIANYGGRTLFSKKFVSEHHLGALSSLQTSLRLLTKREILDKENGNYIFTDVFFKEWIKRRMGS